MGLNQWKPVRPRRFPIDPPKPSSPPQVSTLLELTEILEPQAEEPEVETEEIEEEHVQATVERRHFLWFKPSIRAIIFSAFWLLAVGSFLAYLYLAYLSRINSI